ncbi:hypothetical protein MGN01_14970 [Methylobacterium gnaphalii]|uniref:DUF3309 domain-containing protein n=1 Tax=Methylobacterium gnaphalii TaxID=1010610 RepID=A0A512JIE4_9HYPH|nr:hypothetical protein MGN01_14970 [Methylobacterium gnaphalii]GLS50071.1 hypothetical protein GCM10007885_29230 [Methylobacterium gnaphalii]
MNGLAQATVPERPERPSMVTIILIILILLLFGGGNFLGGGAYRGPGFGLGGILLIVLIVLLLTGRI